jgi:hypothetical protein
MNAQELANYLFDITDMENSPYHKAATMLVHQENLIAVLKANHKIQQEINAKQFEYIAELENGLESSINLNKAQAERQEK